MSSYQNARAQLVARAGVAVCNAIECDQVGVQALLLARQAIAEVQTVDRPTLSAILPSSAELTLQKLAPTEWARLEDVRRQPAVAAASVRTAMTDALEAATRVVGRATQTELVATVKAFVADPAQAFAGVSVDDGESITVVTAARADSDEAVMFAIDQQGQVQREYLHHAGDTCQVRDAAFVAFAADRGVLLDVIESDVHDGKRNGVRMFAPGAERDASNPGAGFVLEVEAPRRNLFAAARRARRTAGGVA